MCARSTIHTHSTPDTVPCRFKKSKAARCIQRFGRCKVLGQTDEVLGGVRTSALRSSLTEQQAATDEPTAADTSARDGSEDRSARSGANSFAPPTMQLPPRYERRNSKSARGPAGSHSGRSNSSNSKEAAPSERATDPLQAMWRGGDDLGDPHVGGDGGVNCWPVDMLSLSDQQSRIMAQAAQAERSVHLAQLSNIHSGVMSGQWAHGAPGQDPSGGGVGAASVAPLGHVGGGQDADAAQDADSAMRVARVQQLREHALQVYLTGLGGAVHRPDADIRRRKLVARMQRHMGALTRPAELPAVLQRGMAAHEAPEGGEVVEQKVDPLAPPSSWSADKAFDETPLPPHDDVAAAGKAAHLRAMRALQADAPWWLVYTPSSLVDLRDVKAAVPWRKWMAEQGYHVPASSELSEAEQAKLYLKRQNREEAAFGTPLTQDSYPPSMASDIWLTAACKAFGGIGSASIAAEYNKGSASTADDGSSPPAPLSSFDAFSIAQGMQASGIVDPWSVPPGALKREGGANALGSFVDMRSASRSAGKAVDEWQAAELSSEEGGSVASQGGGGSTLGGSSIHQVSVAQGDNVTEDFDFALSLLESAPLDIPSVPGVFRNKQQVQNLPSLAAPADSISDRVAAAQAALQRHTRAAAAVRHHSERDRAIAARRIQQAWRGRQVRLAAKAEMHAIQAEQAAAANAEREAKWNDVYGRMAGLLRELVSDATGYTPPLHRDTGVRRSQQGRMASHQGAYSGVSTAGASRGSGGGFSRQDDEESQPPPSPPRDKPSVAVSLTASQHRNAQSMGGYARTDPPLSSTYPDSVAQGFRPLTGLQPPSHSQAPNRRGALGSNLRQSADAESSGEWEGPLASSFKGPSFAGLRGNGILKRGAGGAGADTSGYASADSSARQSVSFARGVDGGSARSRPKVAVHAGLAADGSVLDDSFGALSSVGASTLSGDGDAGGVDLSLSDTGSSAVAAAIKASMGGATPSQRGAATPQRYFQPERAHRAAQPSASSHSDAVAARRAAELHTPQAQVRRSR